MVDDSAAPLVDPLCLEDRLRRPEYEAVSPREHQRVADLAAGELRLLGYLGAAPRLTLREYIH